MSDHLEPVRGVVQSEGNAQAKLRFAGDSPKKTRCQVHGVFGPVMVPCIVGPIEFQGGGGMWKKHKTTAAPIQFVRRRLRILRVFGRVHALHKTGAQFREKLRVMKFRKIPGQNDGGLVDLPIKSSRLSTFPLWESHLVRMLPSCFLGVWRRNLRGSFQSAPV